jgi:hypothetical protein
MWRVLFCPKPPYKPVARFLFAPDVAGVPMDDPNAYAPYTRPSDSVVIPSSFLRLIPGKGGKTTWIEHPQYNQIHVRGLAIDKPSDNVTALAIRAGEPVSYNLVLNHWETALFGNPAQGTEGGPPAPDPDHADYTDGSVNTLYHADPMLTTPEAVMFVARRLFDLKCHAKGAMHGGRSGRVRIADGHGRYAADQVPEAEIRRPGVVPRRLDLAGDELQPAYHGSPGRPTEGSRLLRILEGSSSGHLPGTVRERRLNARRRHSETTQGAPGSR